MRKILSKIHLYLSIPVGLIISVICLTGAAIVFDQDIKELLYKDLYKVEEVGKEALPIEQLVEKLQLQFPGKLVEEVGINGDKETTYIFWITGERGDFFVNQYTGEFLGNYDLFEEGGFYRTMFFTHRWLMDYKNDFSWGKQIVGASTLLMVFIIITGFFIWLPRGIYSLKKSLSIKVNRGWRRFWYDLHIAGGVYIAGGILILGLTGLLWSYPSWFRPMAYTIFNVEEKVRENEDRHDSEDNENTPIQYDIWSDISTQIKATNPDAEYIGIMNGMAYVLNNRYGNIRASDTYNFNPQTGVVENIELYSSTDERNRFMGWAYSIHVGAWGGMFGKTITFIVALLGGIIPITGYYLWFKRVYRKPKKTS